MRPNIIRPIVICVVCDGERIFVSQDVTPDTRETFYRPLGGGVEYAERSADAVVRELREEIGAELADVHCLGTIENVFTYNGAIGHEIVIVYQAQFVEQWLYTHERVDGWDGVDGKQPMLAVWKPLALFAVGHAPLYPDGLFELLTGQEHPAITCRNAVPLL
jgi:8-oxo-dGTP pyrophosphatase MutT (NUDIX family)